MKDKLFINKESFKDYREVSDHMEPEEVNISIREAQVTDLIDFLGPELYLRLQLDYDDKEGKFTDTKLQDLWTGKDYNRGNATRRYHGLEPILTLYAYARLLDNLQLNITRQGPVTFLNNDVSDPTTQAQIKTKVMGARAMAVRYQEEAYDFLMHNKSDYVEWIGHNNVKNKVFTIFKI